ncbi:MAG: hypothetical protein AB1782_17135 [Cyanobacteriota bacterium]
MKRVLVLFIALVVSLVTISETFALINLDDESVKISIKYGLDNKYSTTKELMGPNWIEGENGVIITIYSPFIQLASKAKSQNVPGSSDEDILLVKRRLGRQLNQIKTRMDIRFIVQLVGDDETFAKEYDARIEEVQDEEDTAEEQKKGKGFWIFKDKGPKKPKKVSPESIVKQNKAELDNWNPVHPYSATNSYNFDFERVNKFEKFYFILVGPDEKETRFLVDKNAIF